MSTKTFDELARLEGVERLVHEPARLVILTMLSACLEADFTFLQRATGFSNGNMSLHLSKLGEAGLITIHKDFVRKRPRTRAIITARGRELIDAHWERLARLRHAAHEWREEEEP
jgi:DNA-binding transcriptional ArsR family regulator